MTGERRAVYENEHHLAKWVEDHGPAIETETIQCTTDRWNFPHDRDTPFAKDSICSICGQTVEMISVGPPSEHLYTDVAVRHTRQITWYRINSDDLGGFMQYMEDW